jgi:hypothetical protein
MNRHKNATFEHHALRESFFVMCNIVEGEDSQIGRELVGGAIVRLRAGQLSVELEENMEGNLRHGWYA